ncbi:MAG: hypothetical protein KIG60_08300 [Caryophanon sp.]|nr:hypothetical protein [Caryophanon sp.]
MKIKSTLMAVFVTSIALSVIVLIASIMLTSSMGNLQQTYIDESEILKLKADFIVVSDQLTMNARAYVNTENDVFYNAYMTEVNETQSYARILSEMESLLPANLLGLIQETQAESASLAQQITQIIQAIQQNTVLQMARVNEKVATGVATVSETGQSFAEIIASTENVTQQIQQVSAVSEQMAASAQQISATFESISAISTQSSATTEQVSDLAQEQFAATEEITAAMNLLTDLATKLNEEVNHFKLR